jgi:hypothetical protein
MAFASVSVAANRTRRPVGGTVGAMQPYRPLSVCILALVSALPVRAAGCAAQATPVRASGGIGVAVRAWPSVRQVRSLAIYAEGVYAAASGGLLAAGAGGARWVGPQQGPEEGDLLDVFPWREGLVAVGRRGARFYDGVRWCRLPTPPGLDTARAAAWAAVGDALWTPSAGRPCVLRDPDGAWTPVPTPAPARFVWQEKGRVRVAGAERTWILSAGGGWEDHGSAPPGEIAMAAAGGGRVALGDLRAACLAGDRGWSWPGSEFSAAGRPNGIGSM